MQQRRIEVLNANSTTVWASVSTTAVSGGSADFFPLHAGARDVWRRDISAGDAEFIVSVRDSAHDDMPVSARAVVPPNGENVRVIVDGGARVLYVAHVLLLNTAACAVTLSLANVTETDGETQAATSLVHLAEHSMHLIAWESSQAHSMSVTCVLNDASLELHTDASRLAAVYVTPQSTLAREHPCPWLPSRADGTGVLSFNLWIGGEGRDRLAKCDAVERCCAVIRASNASLVGVQEPCGHDGVDNAALMGLALGWRYAPAPGVLASPDWQPPHAHSPAALGVLMTRDPGTTVWMFNVHMCPTPRTSPTSWRKSRMQMRRFCTLPPKPSRRRCWRAARRPSACLPISMPHAPSRRRPSC